MVKVESPSVIHISHMSNLNKFEGTLYKNTSKRRIKLLKKGVETPWYRNSDKPVQ